MKTKLVLWGSNASGERVLIASALQAKENTVTTWVFPMEEATEEFHNLLINAWRVGEEVAFPESHQTFTIPLSVTDGFLPEGYEVERKDVISRAQAEWHFVVLSSKLYRSYKDELDEFRQKIENLDAFDNGMWEQLKGLWSRVQSQIHDKTLFHEHAKTLREETNAMFTSMKNLRKKMDHEFKEVSKENKEKILNTLQEIEEKIEKGLGLQPLFEDLKNLQKSFKKSKLTRDDRSSLWNRIDAAFKTVKEKRFGPESKREKSAGDRLTRRYEGLLKAIEKMEKSIARDKRDQAFQDRKIEQSEGQLEAQIRQAKLKMIDERVRSKEEKLEEMLKTKTELESRIAVEEKKAEERKTQEEVEKAKEAVKEKIAEEIRQAAEEREDASEKLEKAGEELKAGSKQASEEKKPSEGFVSALGNTLGESLKDVADTVRAVADVIEDRIEDAIDNAKESLSDEEE